VTTRVEQILEKLGIDYERRGARLWALCPYHEDHKASWMIRPSGDRAGQHHCFVCKKGGGLVDLVMQRRGYANFHSAIEWLKNFKEAPPPPVNVINFEVQPTTRKRFQIPKEVRFEPFSEWSTMPKRYLEQRGVSAIQVDRWRIGYAVDSRLAGRIVIPVWTFAGGADDFVPWSYRARTFVDHETRYFFPKESDGPDLDKMFGQLYWPPVSDRRRARVYVTEGDFNALAIERVAPGYIASLGASDVRPAHTALLATFGEVVIVTDFDLAGEHAAELLIAALARHTRIDRVRFPKGEDPDSVTPEQRWKILETARPR